MPNYRVGLGVVRCWVRMVGRAGIVVPSGLGLRLRWVTGLCSLGVRLGEIRCGRDGLSWMKLGQVGLALVAFGWLG